MRKKPEQIDPWLAIQYAVDLIDDSFAQAEFLREAMQSDLEGMRENWPDFVTFQKTTSANDVFVL